MDVRFLLLALFTLVSCLPESQVSKSNLASTNPGTTSGSGDGTASPTNLSWNYLGTKASTISINTSNLNNAYIVGTPIETYLNTDANFDQANYCLVSSYNLGGNSLELRSRVIPISYYDFNAKRTVRVFRVDFNDVNNSDYFCRSTITNNLLKVLDQNGNYVTDTTLPSLSTFDPNLLCPSCTSMLSATRVRIFKKSDHLYEIPMALINLGSLGLQVDPNNNGGVNVGSCTNNECVARGFNCCLENQCVKDGATKPAALTQYQSQWQSAEQEKLQNPLAYRNYPHLYYICASAVPSTPGSTTGNNTTAYEAIFQQLKKDQKCMSWIKSKSVLSPFHNELLNRSVPYPATTECLTATSDMGLTMHYEEVMKRIYKTCGCAKIALADMISSCPAYEYVVSQKDVFNEPTKIDCYTPPGPQPIPTLRTFTVNSRSAPHRYFDKHSGTERNIAEGEKTYLDGTQTRQLEQEGASFEYLDEGKILPKQENFSINAILGPMSITLDKALPAKSVSVEVDQIYLISTTSGYYTPCPTCAKDSWLPSLSAFPSSSYGVGLQAIGHTTERDTLSTNTTGGNYEDTIFGRACWIPPTMIPFTHTSKSSVQDQREKRLSAQAALFINGYQRDWFGFNKGALIGSFDGVTWFAIGKSRIVRSTSKKLFLAINAPFADLANPNLHVVKVQSYEGLTQAAQLDYDPEYPLSHPYQNEAGNCQANHKCSTDTDCITKLGWEYMCTDVRGLQTKWPTFSVDGNEKANLAPLLPIDQILQQKKFPTSDTKRCVYRGSGALCVNNPSTVADLNTRKALTCAPNFYCARVNSSVFNTRISRYASNLEDIPASRNHYFGQDANILGRPLHYLGSTNTTETSSLPSAVQTALSENLALLDPLASSNSGICLPGKILPTSANQTVVANPYVQHQSPDTSKRTDFINQIASCNSGLFTDYRHSTCPVLGSDGNYEMFATSSILANYHLRARNQNACGLETLLNNVTLTSTVDTLQTYSPFRAIEAKPLISQVIVEPTLARDACLRRAGQVCHTDLDCSPNKFHAEQVDYFNLNYFGNEAERNYHSEYLVCGQGDPKPLASNFDAFKSYKINENRCCREVGKDLTSYTADVPTSSASGFYDSVTSGLKVLTAPGKTPNLPKRYSRYATVKDLNTTDRPPLSANHDRNVAGVLTAAVNVTTPNQWKTLGEANSETCCGGGWVRKFSDGSTDWRRRNRLFLDVSNFRCINSRSILLTTPEDANLQYSNSSSLAQSWVSRDYGDYCKDGTNTNGSCAQYSIPNLLESEDNETVPVLDPYTSVRVNTVKPNFGPSNLDNFFMPRSADADSQVFIDYANTAVTARRNIHIKIPSFIPVTDFDTSLPGVVIQLINTNDVARTCTQVGSVSATTPTAVGTCAAANCCYEFDATKRTLKVVKASTMNDFGTTKVGVTFQVNSAGAVGIGRFKPGSTSYYLRRLGRFELSGIPQITFQPLYCSDNGNRLVPGIFNPKIKFLNHTDATQAFSSNMYSFLHNGERYSSHAALQTDPVFAANDFKCCAPLGKTTTNVSKCCSGYGVPQGQFGNTFTCALPAGADLTVYFNRFVSNEGRSSDAPGGGLVDGDFDAQTGEPLIDINVIDKLRALGDEYCEFGKVRQGGAFGSFEPEPQGPDTNLVSRIYGIVDSSRDNGQESNAGQTSNTGYAAFMEGFRWNHHLYCDDQ